MKLFLLLACVCASGAAQTRGARPTNEIRIQQKLALVIGNGAYPGNALKNPVNDAAAMARTLRALGFDDVTEKRDLNRRQMRQENDKFVAKISKGDMAWVYYAGHGVQANERNYLIPVDFTGEESDLEYDAYPADQLRDKLEKSGARLRILILDACRNNPFRGKRGGSRGLVQMDAGDGTFIAFATDPNSVAEDNPNELNGLFTKHLLAALSTPGLDLKQAFQRTREAVYQASGGRQRPHIDDGVIGTYYFNAPVTIVNNNPPSSDLSAQQELAFWNSVDRNDAQTLELYLERYPNGSFVSLAKRSLERLRAPALEASHVGMAAPVNHPTAGTVKTNPKDGQRYVWIPPGRFLMGCSPGDRECFDEEKPTHEVEITKGFWLGETEVTQSAYTRVSGANPSYFDGVDRPVENVNWSEAKNYCMAAGGRLPTESEWEYAARAGTTTSRYDAVNEVGWYEGNSGGRTHPVKEKKPNAWGLYDMLGNVSEWTADAYDANTKTLRGSFFRGYPRLLRVSYRLGLGPDIRNYSTGVRCAWE